MLRQIINICIYAVAHLLVKLRFQTYVVNHEDMIYEDARKASASERGLSKSLELIWLALQASLVVSRVALLTSSALNYSTSGDYFEVLYCEQRINKRNFG